MIGETLQNRYKIISEIGTGGMGRVYLGEDLRLSQNVAVKETMSFENESFYDVEARIRAFQKEARLLAGKIKHAAIPKVIDYFNSGKHWYIVMDYIEGKSLEERRREREQPFAVIDVLLWTDKLLSILNSLHKQNPPIIHCDIKPSNIKVKDGDVYLLDFGLAKQLTGRKSTAASFLTPTFASPEQILNKEITEKSDLYCVAATMYCLLTNEEPKGAIERSIDISSGKPDPLRHIKDVRTELNGRVAETIMKALSFNPEDRPSSAEVMRETLRKAAAPDEIGSRATLPIPSNGTRKTNNSTAPPTPDPVKDKSWRRRFALTTTILTGFIVVLLLSYVAVILIKRSRAQASIQASQPPVVEVTPATLLPTPTPTPEKSPREKAAELTVQAIDKMYENDYEGAQSLAGEALKVDDKYALAHAVYGDSIWDTNYDASEEWTIQHPEIQYRMRQVFELVTSPTTAEDYAAIAWANMVKGRTEETMIAADEAVHLKEDFVWAMAMKASALSQSSCGSVKSIDEWNKVIGLKRKYAIAQSNLALTLSCTNKSKEAIDAATQAIKLSPSPRFYYLRGNLYYKQGNRDAALNNFQEALSRDQNYSPAHYYMAHVYQEQKEFKKCNEELKDALDVSEFRYMRGDLYYLSSECNFSQKKWKEALADIEESLKLYPNNPAYSTTRVIVLRQLSSKDAAKAEEETIKLYPTKSDYYRAKAEILRELGRNSEAERAVNLVNNSTP